ncbi:MAG: CBS domain-containing protein [Bryobacteraceae bacterium]
MAIAAAAARTRLEERIGVILQEKGESVWSIPADASVYTAIKMMADQGIGAVPVLEGSQLIGMLSERDYARKVVLEGRNSRETLVGDIMTTSVATVTAESTIDECMRLMTAKRIRHLPVVRGEQLAGIVSIGDLVNWIISAQQETIEHLTSYIGGSYPG